MSLVIDEGLVSDRVQVPVLNDGVSLFKSDEDLMSCECKLLEIARSSSGGNDERLICVDMVSIRCEHLIFLFDQSVESDVGARKCRQRIALLH